MDWVAGFMWTEWQPSHGLGGRHPWNMHAIEGHHRKTCGRGAKRTQILGMGCSTLRLALGQGSPACRKNGRILLANLLQSSRSTFSWGSLLSFFAFKEGMLGTPISVLGG